MASMPEVATTTAVDTCNGELLPPNPFDSVKYHFGMLLGVDDFETEHGYHGGKMQLHNAWLHRQGVVWGFGVNVEHDRGEIRVKRGLALDAAGRELHLEADHCVNVGEWFAENKKKDPDFDIDPDGFAVHVVICFKACLNRQVPAMLEPCDNGGTGTAYSRIHETVNIWLRPKRAPEPSYPYHWLRVMFGLDAPNTLDQARFDELVALETAKSIDDDELVLLKAARTDREVLKEVGEIEALPADQRRARWLKAFHRFAALDEIDLEPAMKDGMRLLFPGKDEDCVVLADITDLKLTKTGERWILSGGQVDSSVRPSHVATTTIQDLLCGRLGSDSESPPDAGGPRVDPKSVSLSSSKEIFFTADKALQRASVESAAAFSVTWLDPDQGWRKANVVDAAYRADETMTVSLRLDSDVSGLVRLIVFGTGANPVLGADLVPFAGAVGGPPGTRHNGHDLVFMKEYVAPEVNEDEPATEEKIEDSPVRAALQRPQAKKRTSRK